MRNFLATVLSVIAAGVLLIAYGLLSPRAAASDFYPQGRLVPAGDRLVGIEDLTPRAAAAYRISDVRAVQAYDEGRAAGLAERRAAVSRTARTTRTASVRAARSSRDWTKTAMVIGGTTAAGAGLGAIFGGKKGALIGAALGGGAGTLYEVQKK
jgi:hypothetical protein